MTRRVWVVVHRYAGLAIAAFLLLAGLTGSLLAFNTELERVFAPSLFAEARPDVPTLDFAVLAGRAQALIPQARVESVSLTEPDQVSVNFAARQNPATGKRYELGFTEFFVDPWTGMELGRRNRDDITQGWIALMPFIYELHWTLVIGPVGQWTMGIAALIWTIDCFYAFYLTLPTSISGFWRKWRLAWSVKRGASFYRLNFDLHRAGSLWLWSLLLIFAWSSVMMNIRWPVYDWVTKKAFDYESPIDEFMSLPQRNIEVPRLDWHAALATGQRLMAEQAASRHFTAGQPLGLMYMANFGAYIYEVRGSNDIFERAPKGGSTYVMFDGDSGVLMKLSQPTGEHVGNTVESWLYALHMARVFGRPYQVLVCLLGLAIATLSATGVYIWWRKRQARQTSQKRLALHVAKDGI